MTATRIPVELFAEIEGDDVLIKAQPLDHAAVTLLQYPRALAEQSEVIAMLFSSGSLRGRDPHPELDEGDEDEAGEPA